MQLCPIRHNSKTGQYVGRQIKRVSASIAARDGGRDQDLSINAAFASPDLIPACWAPFYSVSTPCAVPTKASSSWTTAEREQSEPFHPTGGPEEKKKGGPFYDRLCRSRTRNMVK